MCNPHTSLSGFEDERQQDRGTWNGFSSIQRRLVDVGHRTNARARQSIARRQELRPAFHDALRMAEEAGIFEAFRGGFMTKL
jgi:hypothetical protein